jgi:hypothetical protein
MVLCLSAEKNYLEWMREMETSKIVNIHIKAATSHVISHFILRDSLSWNTNILPSIHHHLFHYGEENIQFAEARACAFINLYSMLHISIRPMG